MELFDTHCHINSRRFESDLDQVVTRAREAGVTRMVAIGISLETSQRCADIARRYDGVFSAVGIQPNCAHEAGASDWDEITQMLDQPEVIALGETGLDRYWDDCPMDVQEDFFDRHLRLSQARGTPFIVHMRECGEDVLRMLAEARKRGPLRGVMHSFTGDMPLMRECVDIGMHISFAGMVTFKRSDELRKIAADVPADRLLLETDAPYLSPEPVRKQRRNEPGMVIHTARCLAETRGLELNELAALTTSNAKRFFGVS